MSQKEKKKAKTREVCDEKTRTSLGQGQIEDFSLLNRIRVTRGNGLQVREGEVEKEIRLLVIVRIMTGAAQSRGQTTFPRHFGTGRAQSWRGLGLGSRQLFCLSRFTNTRTVAIREGGGGVSNA